MSELHLVNRQKVLVAPGITVIAQRRTNARTNITIATKWTKSAKIGKMALSVSARMDMSKLELWLVMYFKRFLVVSLDFITGCVCPSVRRLVRRSVMLLLGGQRRDGERLISCVRTCLVSSTRRGICDVTFRVSSLSLKFLVRFEFFIKNIKKERKN